MIIDDAQNSWTWFLFDHEIFKFCSFILFYLFILWSCYFCEYWMPIIAFINSYFSFFYIKKWLGLYMFRSKILLEFCLWHWFLTRIVVENENYISCLSYSYLLMPSRYGGTWASQKLVKAYYWDFDRLRGYNIESVKQKLCEFS